MLKNHCFRYPTLIALKCWSSTFSIAYNSIRKPLNSIGWVFFPWVYSWFPYISCREGIMKWRVAKSLDHSTIETEDFISNLVRGQVCQILPVRLRSLEPQCGMRQHWAHPQCPGIRNPDSCLLVAKQFVINLAHSWILFWGKNRMRFVNQIWDQHFVKHSLVWAWTSTQGKECGPN